MSGPREGSREIGEGLIISEAYDWCRSPEAPVPYRIWAYQREAMNLADSVRQTDERSHAKESIVLHCYGDEAGVGGGVISGTHNAECTPKTWSATVRAESRNMVRHDDEWWMNHGNTWGRLHYIKDQTFYLSPDQQSISPKMWLAQYTAAPPVETPMGPMPGPAQAQQLQNVGKALQQGYKEQFGPGTMPLWQRPTANIERYKEQFDEIVKRLREGSNVRVSNPGKCTPDQHRNLQDRVDNACGGAGSCRGGDTPAMLQAKIAAQYACIEARKRINDTCFQGGDKGHNDAIAQREQAIARCWKLGGRVPSS